MTDTSDWRELLQLLKQQAALPAQSDLDEATLDRITSLSKAALESVRAGAPTAAAAAAASPDSSGQLLELLLSTLKVVEAGGFANIDYGEVQHADDWCMAAARTSAAALTGQQSGDDSGALSKLPWLVLFGRCCMYLHRHLQKADCTGMVFPQGSFGPGQQLVPPPGRPGVDWYRLWEGCEGAFIARKPSHDFGLPTGEDAAAAAGEDDHGPAAEPGDTVAASSGSTPQFATWLAGVMAWLQDSDTAAQLAAAGVSADALLAPLQEAAAALRRLQQLRAKHPIELMGSTFTVNLGAASSAGGLQQDQGPDADKQLGVAFVRQLGPLGLALSALPLSCACNNPLCRNLEGVGGDGAGAAGPPGSLCAACRRALYCSKVCQKSHWKQHKPVCQALAAAGAGAAAAAAGPPASQA